MSVPGVGYTTIVVARSDAVSVDWNIGGNVAMSSRWAAAIGIDRGLVGRRERRLQDPHDRERLALEHQDIPDVLLELARDVRAQDGHVRALVLRGERPPFRVVEHERLAALRPRPRCRR